jgi:hypothetical protein
MSPSLISLDRPADRWNKIYLARLLPRQQFKLASGVKDKDHCQEGRMYLSHCGD